MRRECDPLDPKDIKSPQVKNIIKCMKFALKRYDGVGISAPQIGKGRRPKKNTGRRP